MSRTPAVGALLIALASNAIAADADPATDGAATTGEGEPPLDYETVIVGNRPATPSLPAHRAGSEVTRGDLEARLPRSAPDALRYEPGVFVQQTAHGQGSAFVRGLTGQQTLLMFDGIRLNNGTYRQGPNQYFFTLDSHTIQSVQVVRGGGSTRYGSDALGGVILALPIEPELGEGGIDAEPHLVFRGATADAELGGRAQLGLRLGDRVAWIGGAGARRVGQLESGGVVNNPEDGEQPRVPRFADDGRTQLGTGFDELTADGRVAVRIADHHTLKLAAYIYRQLDAPRTDQCPAAYAPFDECLTYDEQFRTLAYAAWEGLPRQPMMNSVRATLSWQRQHERRRLRRPSAKVVNIGRDTVDTFGATWVARSAVAQVTPWLRSSLRWGADAYRDQVASAAWIRFTDIEVTEQRSRGQYLDDSNYTYGGAFAAASAQVHEAWRLRVGGRVSWIVAEAASDAASGSAAVDRAWFPLVANAGVEWRPLPWLSLLTHVDRSFRAPNLDDMTSRQQTGPGFQFENPDLAPEIATTYELGVRADGRVRAELWGFWTALDGAVVKSPRDVSDCPPSTPRCQASWTRFQLVNAAGRSMLRGLEVSAYGELPWGLSARGTLAWTRGEGPDVTGGDEPVPLSRVPPLNGTAELGWRHTVGISAGAALRWANPQERLALADISDARIPAGGTPGFAVVDLRVSYRLGSSLLASLALENLFDAAYRYHGSSVNGPGRGLSLLLDVGPLWREL